MARRYLQQQARDLSTVASSRSVWGVKCLNNHKNNFTRWFSASLLLLIIWQWGSGGWILVKAQLAQWLIAEAWEETVEQGTHHSKPWSWADTYPVARLQMRSRDVDLYVLEGAQGNSLAFGPGHLQGTALPGEGVSIIGGHRDTHFHFLKDVVPGDELQLETGGGRRLNYRIEHVEVVDSRYTSLTLDGAGSLGLVLVTCYPFDAINSNGPLRLVVRARELTEVLREELLRAGDLLDPMISSADYINPPQFIYTL